MRTFAHWMFAATLLTPTALAQGIPGEFVPAGETVATTTDANSGRLDPGAVALSNRWSARLTGVGEFQSNATALDGAALTVTSPLMFDFAGAVGLTWQHSRAQAAHGDVVTGELGLAYAFMQRLGVGVRVRIEGAYGDPSFAPLANGAAAVDVGAALRVTPWLSLGLVGLDLVGPTVAPIGLERALMGGVGIRPFGTDALTLGVDGSYAQSGTGLVRVGARVHVPRVGFIRAEGVLNLPGDAWIASAGLEIGWGQYSAGGGVMFGGTGSSLSGGPLGGFASVGVDETRQGSVFAPDVVIAVPVESELGTRALGHLVLRLERLRHDPAVRGMVIAIRGEVTGLANAEELRDEFARWHASGLRVVCHLTEPNGSAYYACAGADAIVMDPAGSLRSAGIRTGFYFLGDALRDIGVRTEFVRIGAWKDAPEQFTRRGSSPEARAQEETLLDDFYQNFTQGIADARSSHAPGSPAWTPERVRTVIEAGPYTARGVFAAGMIDALGTRDEAYRVAARLTGADVVDIDHYAPRHATRWSAGPTVAVVYVDGDMIDGESFEVPYLDMRFVGDRTIIGIIDALAADDHVRAIVLRIDSGGGAAMAGETMWRAIHRAARGKPVVVSMGRTAASAAYYIAAPAREIIADASTTTGSIGIFFGKADIATLLGRLDVGVELLRRGPRADMDSIFRGWSAEERTLVGNLILEFYNQFLDRVAEGRHMTRAVVNASGEGRVFAASRMRALGFVDRIGGLATALERARVLAGLDDDSEVEELPVESGGLLATLGSLLADDPRRAPTARLLTQTELRTALQWLMAVDQIGPGRPIAMTDWPILSP